MLSVLAALQGHRAENAKKHMNKAAAASGAAAEDLKTSCGLLIVEEFMIIVHI